MKKILCTLLLFSILFSITSCDKLLDRKPYTMFENDVVLTPEGMQALLTGAYAHMASRDYYGKVLFLYEAAKSPDFWMRNIDGGLSFHTEARNGESDQTNGNARLIWVAAYNVIRNLTILIENIDDVRGDIDELRRIRGEAHVLRGLAYFDLMRLFAYPPLYSIEGQDRYEARFRWGLPILSTVEKGTNIFNHEVRRETAETTYAFIIEELETGYRLLEARSPRGNGFTGAAAAKALLIRAHLYLNDWQKVVEYGEYWMARYSSRYSIIPWESWPSTHHKPFNSESIWEFGYSNTNHLGTNALNYWVRYLSHDEPGSDLDGSVVTTNIGFAKLGLTWGELGEPNLHRGRDILERYEDDIRKTMIVPMGIHGHPEYVTLRRFIGTPTHFIHNVPVVGLPEVILSIAEGYCMLGNLGQASYYLSKITLPRRKREVTIIANAAEGYPTEVSHVHFERRRELMLMGHNYWDFFRRGRNLVQVQMIGSNNLYEEIIFAQIGAPNSLTGVTTGRNWRAVYPIPLAEMTANRAIRGQQNPGYRAFDEEGQDES